MSNDAAIRDPAYREIGNEIGVLHDVLSGRPDYLRRAEAGPLVGRRLKNMRNTAIEFDFDPARRQRREMAATCGVFLSAMPMFTLGGDRAYCLCQALNHDSVEIGQ